MKAIYFVSGIIALLFAAFILYVFQYVFSVSQVGFASVAALILVGLAAFIGIMNILSFSVHAIGISDRNQPFGLPEGTVRAILTISFIVLVGVLASFLLTNTHRQPFVDASISLGTGMTAQDAQALVQKYSSDGLVVQGAPDKDGKVSVQFHARNDFRVADDVAKQILTILSTILAAMIGFYFGARPADAAASTAAAAAAGANQDERTKLLRELDTFAAPGPTAQSIRTAIAAKPPAITGDPQKKAQIDAIEAKLKASETKYDTAHKTLSDATQPIDKVRLASADGKAALKEFAALNDELGKIT